METEAAIEWRGFGKKYPRASGWAVKETSLKVSAGTIFGIFGRNGSGKTTLMRGAAGLIRPTVGSVYIEGQRVTRAALASGHVVGYMPQRSLSLNSMTVGESVRWFSAINDLSTTNRELRDSVIDELNISPLWRFPVKSLSGGQAKLVQFVVAFCTNSRTLVLDEPTNELDTINRRKLWRVIASARTSGRTIAVVSHNILEATDVVTDIAIVHNGTVALRGPAHQIASEISGLLTVRHTTPDSRGRYNVVDEIDVHQVPRRVEQLIGAGVTDIDIGPPQLEEIFCRVVGGS